MKRLTNEPWFWAVVCWLFTVLIFVVGLTRAFGQATTEVFIPIGQSPGVSGTAIGARGTVTGVNIGERALEVNGILFDIGELRSGPHGTIYIDNSAHGAPNQYGTFDDLLVGIEVEMLAPGGVAKWIKIRGEER